MDTVNLEKLCVWQFTGKPGNLRSQNRYSNDGYHMILKTNNRILTYVEDSQPPGYIDLALITDADKNAKVRKCHFRLPDGKEREILTGELVSLEIGGGDASLYYSDRRPGISFMWSGPPVFEFRFFDPTGEKGKVIPTGQWVAVLNDAVKPHPDFLVPMDRIGADVAWTTTVPWTERVSKWVTDQAIQVLVQALAS